MSAKHLLMDQIQATHLKKLSSQEYSQTNESSQPNKWTRSDHGQKFDVFISHSGKQKNFVRQLYRDLTNQGLLCFFDEDRESLPVTEDFPTRIFEAVETCRLALFLLSEDFLHSKWPMLELAACVKARHTNSTPKILPLIFIISPALKAIRPINGLRFSEGGNEVEFRDEVVKEICNKLPTAPPRYHVPYMQGELRMCQEVADFCRDVHPNEKGIIIAGLYGVAGQGKTTLGKAFCNHKLKDFEGKVCHLEFSRGDSFDRTKLALQYLIHCRPSYLQDLTKDQAQVELHRRVNGQRVLLVLDNITEEIIDEVTDFLKANFRESSCILLSARSFDVLVKYCKIDQQSCMRVPCLDEDNAIAILLERTSPEESTLGADDKAFALKCANRRSFKESSFDSGRRGRTFHPLALKAFGSHLFVKYGSTLSKWVAEIDGLVDPSGYGLDGVFAVLDKAFDDLVPKYRTIFMLLTIYILPNMSSDNVTEWLAISCNEEIEQIKKAVADLCDGRSTIQFISGDNEGFELAKLELCMRRSPSQIAPESLKNLLVLQLIGLQHMYKLDLCPMNRLRTLVTRNATGKPHFAFPRQKRVSRLKRPFLSHLTVPIGCEGVCSKNICQFFVLATVCCVLLGY
ncbi:hypothetical protein SUGI_0960210 [Cryptomeria japonica]|nr:hypothetical protein SUGI_0960210 [Cryptomeria japonica]